MELERLQYVGFFYHFQQGRHCPLVFSGNFSTLYSFSQRSCKVCDPPGKSNVSVLGQYVNRTNGTIPSSCKGQSFFFSFYVTASRFLHKRVRKIIRVDCSVVEMVHTAVRTKEFIIMMLLGKHAHQVRGMAYPDSGCES